MNTSSILMGIVPLIIFVVIDSFLDMKYALVGAILSAFLEGIVSYVLYKEIDSVTIFSFVTIIILAFITYRTNSPTFFLFQPVLVSMVLSLSLLISYALKRPLFLTFMMKYKNQLPEMMQQQLGNPLFLKLLQYATFYTGIALTFHAIATAFAALKLSKWWWLIIRGVGFYVFLFMAFIASQIHLRSVSHLP